MKTIYKTDNGVLSQMFIYVAYVYTYISKYNLLSL